MIDHIGLTASDFLKSRDFYVKALAPLNYQAAMAAGGKDNGGPGLRPQYHANYYGAFVLDRMGIILRPFVIIRNKLLDII